MLTLGLLAIFLTQLPTSASSSHEQRELQVRLGATVENYSVSECDFARTLVAVGLRFDVPLGIEWIESAKESPKVTRSWKKTTVGHIFESLVTSRPGYSLEVQDGVVHVFYRGSSSDQTNFLNLPLANFEARHEYVSSISQNLRVIAKGAVSPPSGNARSWMTETVVSAGERQTTFQLEKATVRDALDRLALATDAKMWVVTFRGDSGLTPTGFRRTATLWNDHPLADDQQPVWDLLYVRNQHYLCPE